MNVKFKVNLGSMDAAKLDVDFKQCVADAEVNVSDVVGKWLVERGIASDVTPPKPEPIPVAEPKELQAVPDDDAALEAATAPVPATPTKKQKQ